MVVCLFCRNENDKFWLISFLRQLTVLGNDALQQLKTTLDEHRKSKVLPSQKGNKNEVRKCLT